MKKTKNSRRLSDIVEQNIQTIADIEKAALDARSTVDRIADHIKGMPNGELAFGQIDRDSKDAEQIRSYMRKKLAAARLDEDRDKMTHALNVKLEVPPKAEKVDSGGKVLLLYALGPFLGILIAFVFSLVAESMDHTLRTPVEVEKYLGKPVLAVIPKMQPARQSGRKRLAGSSRGNISS